MHFVLPEDGTLVPKHVADTPLIFMYNCHRAFGWCNKLSAVASLKMAVVGRNMYEEYRVFVKVLSFYCSAFVGMKIARCSLLICWLFIYVHPTTVGWCG